MLEQGEGGGSLGFPLMHVKITLLGGEVHETGSNELAFRYRRRRRLRKALREAGIVLLEPIMRIEVTVPEEHLGDIMGDLQQRRAIITRTHTRGRNTVIEAHAPLANLFGYSSAMRGLSQGRATCTMEPHSTAPPRRKCSSRSCRVGRAQRAPPSSSVVARIENSGGARCARPTLQFTMR